MRTAFFPQGAARSEEVKNFSSARFMVLTGRKSTGAILTVTVERASALGDTILEIDFQNVVPYHRNLRNDLILVLDLPSPPSAIANRQPFLALGAVRAARSAC